MREQIRSVHDLIGEEISGVEFVRDYVEFHFDGPVLRCIADPTVVVRGVSYRFPGEGSRDALCQMIGASIESLNLTEGIALEFVTSNACQVVIPLDDAHLPYGEAMHFVPWPNQPIQVW